MAWAYNTPDGTPNNAPHIIAVVLSVTILALVALCLRLYVRTMMIKAMGSDDWIIIVSWLGCCGYAAAIVVQTKWGLGLVELKSMPPENISNFGLVQFTASPLYIVGIWGFKMSLLISYMRFLPGVYRILSIIIATAVTLSHIAFICVFIFLCTPIEKQWRPDLPGHCANGYPFYVALVVITILFDISVLVLPFPTLIKLQLKLRKKLVLLGLFALGVFVTIVQIIRMRSISQLKNYLDSAQVIMWSIIETALGIIIACVPTLKPLIKSFADRTTSAGAGGQSTDGAKRGDEAPYALQSWKGSGPHGNSSIDKDSDGDSKPGDAWQS